MGNAADRVAGRDGISREKQAAKLCQIMEKLIMKSSFIFYNSVKYITQHQIYQKMTVKGAFPAAVLLQFFSYDDKIQSMLRSLQNRQQMTTADSF